MSEKQELGFLASVGGAVIGVPILMLVGVPFLMYRAYVLTCLWLWFVVPVFTMKPLPFSMACGLSILVSFFQPINQIKQEYKNPYWQQFLDIVLMPTVGLLFGYAIKWWFGL